MPWWDFFKLWTYSFEKGPLERQSRNPDQMTGAGISMPEAIPDLRGDSWSGGGKGSVALRDSNDFVDLSTVTNRQARYKEYERLRNVPEIEMAMTVIADDACVAGFTRVATLFDGYKSIRWLKDRWDREQKPFLVYCYDFEKQDYTLGWAYDPRIVKKASTIKVLLDNGESFVVTPDHRILLRNEEWMQAGDLKHGAELMPFYKLAPNKLLNDVKFAQYPRIFTFEGWKHERQFIDDWKFGRTDEKYEKVNQAARLLAAGVPTRGVSSMMKHEWYTIDGWIRKEGFTSKELKWLGTRKDRRRVVGILPWREIEVFDMSVHKYENFCTDSVVMHNCQRDQDNNVLQVKTKNEEVKKELEYLLLNRKRLNLNRRSWQMIKRLCIFGDGFYELIIDPESPKDGIIRIQELPPDSIYKIVTTKNKLVEYQQSKEGPDYLALTRNDVTKATESELQQSTAIRFTPKQLIHFLIGDDRKTFYPYGQSLIEPARSPAHQLRLMEDAMVVYRLTRAPERRVFYIDVGQLPPFKAEAFLDRIKDQFRKKKVATNKTEGGAGAVEERWHAPAADEDYWLPIRQNSNTRIETLPGAQNLGEIDDALYFRNKLFTALNFPRNYLNNEDPGATRITLSAQDYKFARMIERIQSHFIDGIIELCERHLELMGYPSEAYEDLEIEMTPPSAWKELSEAEIMSNRINWITSFKSSMLMSDYDLLKKFLKLPDDEIEDIVSRNKIQKLEELKLQIIGQNPQLLGVGVPGQPNGEAEMGAEAGGPNPMLGPMGGGGAPPGGMPPMGPMPGNPQRGDDQKDATETPTAGAGYQGQPSKGGAIPLEDPSEEDLKMYDLELQSYNKTVDAEDIDFSEET